MDLGDEQEVDMTREEDLVPFAPERATAAAQNNFHPENRPNNDNRQTGNLQGFLSQYTSQIPSADAGLGIRRGVREDFNSPAQLRAQQASRQTGAPQATPTVQRRTSSSNGVQPASAQRTAPPPAPVQQPQPRQAGTRPDKDAVAGGARGRIHLSEMPPGQKLDKPDEATPRSSPLPIGQSPPAAATERSLKQQQHQGNRVKFDTPPEEIKPKPQPQTAATDGQKTSILRARQVDAYNNDMDGLPAEKGFPIQIGSELFRLSGASIMSDAPSYFSKFFQDQLSRKNTTSNPKSSSNSSSDEGGGSGHGNNNQIRTLYIDRDPATFQDIALHLQGYYVKPRDGSHYVKLFADAQFYSLPRLIKQLFESEIYIRIGEQDFQVSRDIFSSPGNTPNFFTLGFAIFAPAPGEIFPGVDREGLFRPPSIDPPSLLNRSSRTFGEILHLLRGYPLHVRDAEHREELLRDCRYYHLRGLEQELIQHEIGYNVARQRSEILMRLEDIRQSGVSFAGDAQPSERSPLAGWVNYARPFVDESSHELVLEVGPEECTRISLRTLRAEFFGKAKARITSLFQVVANKMNLPTNIPLGLMMSAGGAASQSVSPGNTPLSDDLVKIAVNRDAHIVLDGEEYDNNELYFRSEMLPSYEQPDAGGAEPYHSTTDLPNNDNHIHNVSLNNSNNFLSPPSPNPRHRSPPPLSSLQPPHKKRKRRGSLDDFGEWIVRRGQWRLRVQPRPEHESSETQSMEIVLTAVKLDAVSGQRGRNTARGWLR